MKRTVYYSISGAIFLGLLVRTPGIFWGYNFPTKWVTHHVDEWTHIVNTDSMVNPKQPPRWTPHPYPKGMASHVAVPLIIFRAFKGDLFEETPSVSSIFVMGRIISVIYGTATILIVFLLARCLFQDPRVALLASWIFALGGLHVSQSHFFLADVPCLFWFLLGSYFLLKEFDVNYYESFYALSIASFCFGIAFGIKILIITIPTLFLLTIRKKPWLQRSVHVAIFFLAGFVIVNIAFYTPYDFARTLYKGLGDPYIKKWMWSTFLYLIEFPSIVSLPVAISSLIGCCLLLKKFLISKKDERFYSILIVIFLPIFIHLLLVIFKLDHFARHFILLIPWISVASAWFLIRIINNLKLKGVNPTLVIVPFFVYLAIFVYDGEKVFIKEPRNEAANWLHQNVPLGSDISWTYHGEDGVPGYNHVSFPYKGRPSIVIIEMHAANHYLSGQGFKNSYPKDYRYVFDCQSPEILEAYQDLFTGKLEYEEVARFKEGYFMPEYLLVNKLIGDRSRNYVTEIVIFAKKTAMEKDDRNEGSNISM